MIQHIKCEDSANVGRVSSYLDGVDKEAKEALSRSGWRTCWRGRSAAVQNEAEGSGADGQQPAASAASFPPGRTCRQLVDNRPAALAALMLLAASPSYPSQFTTSEASHNQCGRIHLFCIIRVNKKKKADDQLIGKNGVGVCVLSPFPLKTC